MKHTVLFCRQTLALLAALLPLSAARAAFITELTRTFNLTPPSGDLADLQNPAQTFTQNITDSAIQSLSRVTVGLHLAGNPTGSGFAGDMVVYLNKDFGANSAFLLNRPGVDGSHPFGYSFDGWDVTFDDAAPNGDAHLGSVVSGLLTGTWQPDGRILPTDTLRPGLLSVLNGTPGNGTYVLAIGDLGLGSQMRLQSWSLTLAGETAAVPETGTWAMGVFMLMGVGGFELARRRQAAGAKPTV